MKRLRALQLCNFAHPSTICQDLLQNGKCYLRQCPDRHPNICTYWQKEEGCRRSQYCTYLHLIIELLKMKILQTNLLMLKVIVALAFRVLSAGTNSQVKKVWESTRMQHMIIMNSTVMTATSILTMKTYYRLTQKRYIHFSVICATTVRKPKGG